MAYLLRVLLLNEPFFLVAIPSCILGMNCFPSLVSDLRIIQITAMAVKDIAM
jgi:hypothetical protein